MTQGILREMRRILRSIELHSRQLVARHGVTVPQLLVLQALDTPGGKGAGELARDVCLSQGTLTDLLIRLEGRGLVERTQSATDRRRQRVCLTPAGHSLVDLAPPLMHNRFLHELESLQEWERTQILASLQRVAAMMEAGELDAAPMLAHGAILIDPEPGSGPAPLPNDGPPTRGDAP